MYNLTTFLNVNNGKTYLDKKYINTIKVKNAKEN